MSAVHDEYHQCLHGREGWGKYVAMAVSAIGRKGAYHDDEGDTSDDVLDR